MSDALADLFRRREAQSRSISAENPTGAKGGGGLATAATSLRCRDPDPSRELGPGWKVSPCLTLEPGQTATLMDVDGPGVIRHLWLTAHPQWQRDLILRMTWDGAERPAVECPLGDFFCNAWGGFQPILGIPVNVNPSSGFNCYWPMPFARHARITLTNDSALPTPPQVYYQIDYTLEAVPADALCFHAQWRRVNPLPYGEVVTILDGVHGRGHYVGTFAAWQQNSPDWWGEGELKFWLDGDTEAQGGGATICGTGTEDYFGGAWCFQASYSAPYLGYRLVSGQANTAGARHTLYRFHVPDPIHFSTDLRVTMQALGWRSGGRFLPLQDDIATVAYWYQSLPTAPFPPLPDRNAREEILPGPGKMHGPWAD